MHHVTPNSELDRKLDSTSNDFEETIQKCHYSKSRDCRVASLASRGQLIGVLNSHHYVRLFCLVYLVCGSVNFGF